MNRFLTSLKLLKPATPKEVSALLFTSNSSSFASVTSLDLVFVFKRSNIALPPWSAGQLVKYNESER